MCASADSSFARNAGKAATALALSAALALTAAPEAFAKDVQPYAGLTPCKTNAAFAKREKNEIKGLTKRLKNVRAQPAAAGAGTPAAGGEGLRAAGYRARRRRSRRPAARNSLTTDCAFRARARRGVCAAARCVLPAWGAPCALI